jgi:hypothetical protein
VVVETSGAPEGFETALGLARREVHLKSTSGRPAGGLRHATELVVDELRLVPAAAAPPNAPDVARVSSLAEIDAAIRPDPARAESVVGPRGTLVLACAAGATDPLRHAVSDRGARVTTSRCGDLRAALPILCEVAAATPLDRLVTRTLPAERLDDGYAAARAPGAGKIVMRHAPPAR